MKFGFIAHPTSVLLKRHAKLLDMFSRTCKDQSHGYQASHWQKQNLVPFTRFEKIVSKTGAQCSGIIEYMPLTAEEMLAQPKAIVDRIRDGIIQLHQEGAQLVGLGGFTGIVGQRGQETANSSPVPVTTGNSLTAFVAYQNMLDVLHKQKQQPADTEVAIVGYPGSISLVIAKLLLPLGVKLQLVHRNKNAQPAKLLTYLPDEYHHQVQLTKDISSCYDKVKFYVAATSTGGVIDPMLLMPGAVVIDTALPRDVMPMETPRHDIMLIDGGLISATDDVSFGGALAQFDPTMFMNGCLAETLILALENRAETFSIGRELDVERVLEIGEIAIKHGFKPAPLASLGEKVRDKDWAAITTYHQIETSLRSLLPAPLPEIKSQTIDRYRQYINPVMADFYEFNHLERVFVQSQGVELTDTNEDRYLDFVAGYGCLNVGHNHPKINASLIKYFESQQPTFVQYISVPYQASLLAEHLEAITPGNLSRTFFSNSGTEAVEAAIKLALAASSKTRLLYCDNGYHGKTLGALSVTGRDKHRKPFEPLLPRCDCIAFGDEGALEAALKAGDVCAFILEPIQGEGGVIIPPDNYLTQVRALCDKYDCLMILDEIQTGLGRTGKMFCCQWEQVVPDIMTLSKS
ncbi:MAG: aminotransferase class III-fold pyridoxal phosphate-dependent enzyme, partial [Gammaproteobacteria bacterium]|nr:aminotransferase class III-fold pyridoxal phosphate-dependent enzyme [Gammaproteobacteria bacterium]